MRPRFSISGMAAVVAFFAISTAALRSRSEAWNTFFFLATCSTLVLAAVAAASRAGERRARALAFAAFGSAYLALCIYGDLPTNRLLYAIYPFVDPPPAPVVAANGFDGIMCSGGITPEPGLYFRDVIGHCLFSLALAGFAALVAPLLMMKDDPVNDELPSSRLRQVAKLMGLLIVIGLSLVGLSRAPGPTATAALLVTSGFLTFALIAAASSQAHRRAAPLGFALFGAGYMALAFGPQALPTFWPRLAGQQLINVAIARLPDFVSSEASDPRDTLAQANSRIRHALDLPVSLHLSGEITLEDFVKAVRAATKGPDGHPIPIHVDPIGLQNVDKVMGSILTVDFDGARLRTTLRLALIQLNMSYYVVDGVLVITSADDETRDALLESNHQVIMPPVYIVGHCSLALVVAALGGKASKRIAGNPLA